MITKQELLKQELPISTAGVLSSVDAAVRAKAVGTLVVHSNRQKNLFFFSDSHMFMHPLLKGWVPKTCVFPDHVTPREGLEDGIIDTVEKYLFIFEQGKQQINSIDELVDHINNQREEELTPFKLGETYRHSEESLSTTPTSQESLSDETFDDVHETALVTDEMMTNVNELVFDIGGNPVTFKELRADVHAAKEKGFTPYTLAFTTVTVEALLDYIEMYHIPQDH